MFDTLSWFSCQTHPTLYSYIMKYLILIMDKSQSNSKITRVSTLYSCHFQQSYPFYHYYSNLKSRESPSFNNNLSLKDFKQYMTSPHSWRKRKILYPNSSFFFSLSFPIRNKKKRDTGLESASSSLPSPLFVTRKKGYNSLIRLQIISRNPIFTSFSLFFPSNP